MFQNYGVETAKGVQEHRLETDTKNYWKRWEEIQEGTTVQQGTFAKSKTMDELGADSSTEVNIPDFNIATELFQKLEGTTPAML